MGQRGAALAIGLILLAVASLVTITSINTGVMQERMSANQDNHARAFMAAEAGGASLIASINPPNGWPTTNPLPGTNNLIAGNPSITFTLSLRAPSTSWAVRPLNVLVEGFARSADGNTVLARTQLLVELRPPAADAPAAISCFRGPCGITAGSGGGANVGYGNVSGFNHPIPENCQGRSCRVEPLYPDDARTGSVTAMPAVYLEVLVHPTDPTRRSSIGGGSADTFQGLNRTDTGIASGNNIDVVARIREDYPPDPTTGLSTAPTLNSVFGTPVPPATSSVPTTTRLESGRNTLSSIGGSNEEVGTLVINGGTFSMRGNSLFVGLIIIRNCGTLDIGGNPNIFGAVIVDARHADGSDCPRDYAPFVGNGTPAVRFSRDALQSAANISGSGPGVDVVRWTEFLQ
jgi:hypothetical protein